MVMAMAARIGRMLTAGGFFIFLTCESHLIFRLPRLHGGFDEILCMHALASNCMWADLLFVGAVNWFGICIGEGDLDRQIGYIISGADEGGVFECVELR